MSGFDYGVDAEWALEWALAQVERTRRENALNASESVAAGPAEESASKPGEAVSVDVRGQSAPAERLRRAADLIGQRAKAATPGPWHPDHPYRRPDIVKAVFVECGAEDGCDGVDCIDGTHGIGGFETDPDNRWALTVDPRLGPLLAALLRDAVDEWGEPDPHALALADQILDGEGE